MLEWRLYLLGLFVFLYWSRRIQHRFGCATFGCPTTFHLPRILTQTIIFSCLSIPIILALIPAGRWLLETAGLSIEEMLQAQTYLTILMAFNGLNLFRESLSGYFGGLGKTRVVLLSTLIMGLANVGANYVLIFGKLGFPALGIAGAGYGTVFAWLVGFLALCVVYFRQIQLLEYQLLKSFSVGSGNSQKACELRIC